MKQTNSNTLLAQLIQRLCNTHGITPLTMRSYGMSDTTFNRLKKGAQ